MICIVDVVVDEVEVAVVGVVKGSSVTWPGICTTFSNLAGLGVCVRLELELGEYGLEIVPGVKLDGLGGCSWKGLDGGFLGIWLWIRWSSNKQTHGGHSWGSLYNKQT